MVARAAPGPSVRPSTSAPRITTASASNSSRAFTGYVLAEVPRPVKQTLTALGRNLLEPALAA